MTVSPVPNGTKEKRKNSKKNKKLSDIKGYNRIHRNRVFDLGGGFMKKSLALFMCVIMMGAMLSGCEKKEPVSIDFTSVTTTDTSTQEKKDNSTSLENIVEQTSLGAAKVYTGFGNIVRPELITFEENSLYEADLVPCVPAYTFDDFIAQNNENVGHPELYWSDEMLALMKKNNFAVNNTSTNEFFQIYEYLRYSPTNASYVTVDSLMHTYHLYFAHLLKTTEKTYLARLVKNMSLSMLEVSKQQLSELEGTVWEEAATRNVGYFAVACRLCGEEADVPDALRPYVDEELKNIENCETIATSPLMGVNEDYTQYKVRGYYEGDEELSKYFKAMMWYGRMNFDREEEDLNRSALLMTLGISECCQADWEAVYGVTSFFAGASDDHLYCDYIPAIVKAYGDNVSLENLKSDAKAFDTFTEEIKKLSAPQIQSVPVNEGEENVIPGMRFMGQRFTIDACIMQNLIYRQVEENKNGERRMLPNVCDVPAALGSDMALSLANEAGADRFPDYKENMQDLRKALKNAPEGVWKASLYSQWINVLTPLLTPKGEGYPSYMTNDDYTKKTIETFAGSYAELKHDTILYGKPCMAERGGGGDEEYDKRGYVEPEPLVYARFASLADATLKGLQKCKLISDKDIECLSALKTIAERLLVIAQKELKNELPTKEEFDYIEYYGADIEHLWYDIMEQDYPGVFTDADEHPSALVADIATDPNGTILEIANGRPCEIAVLVPVDGIYRVAYGAVYNYYEFEWPMSDRLTDSKWGTMCGAIYMDDNYDFIEPDPNLSDLKPDWTMSYRP